MSRNKNAGRVHTLQTIYNPHKEPTHTNLQKSGKLKELINKKLDQRMNTLHDSPRKKLSPL